VTSPTEFARRRNEKPPRPRGHFSFADLGGFLLLLAILYVAVPVWARSESGRETLARGIESVIDDQIRGSVRIGAIDRIDEEGIAGRDIVFFDESGRRVLEADDVELAIDWDELTRGHVVSPRGTVRGGRVLLETIASGELLIDRAFESAHPGESGAPVGEDVVRLENLVASNIQVLIRIHGGGSITARRVSTEVLVRAPENGSALLQAERVRALLHIEAPIPIDLDVRRGQVDLDGSARRRSSIDFPSTIGGEGVRVTVVVRADQDENMHLDVRLHPESVGAMFTGAHLFTQAIVAETIADRVDVTVDF
jgi:hypothetical protein